MLPGLISIPSGLSYLISLTPLLPILSPILPFPHQSLRSVIELIGLLMVLLNLSFMIELVVVVALPQLTPTTLW